MPDLDHHGARASISAAVGEGKHRSGSRDGEARRADGEGDGVPQRVACPKLQGEAADEGIARAGRIDRRDDLGGDVENLAPRSVTYAPAAPAVTTTVSTGSSQGRRAASSAGGPSRPARMAALCSFGT
jgi:hypothetical protein